MRARFLCSFLSLLPLACEPQSLGSTTSSRGGGSGSNPSQVAGSDEVAAAQALSTVRFATIGDGFSSRALVEAVEENRDGTAREAYAYRTTLGRRTIHIYFVPESDGSATPPGRQASLTLSDAEGSWAAVAGMMTAKRNGDQLEILLQDIILEGDDGVRRSPASGSVTGQTERQCFNLDQDERPVEPINADGTVFNTAPLVRDVSWSSSFCAAQR